MAEDSVKYSLQQYPVIEAYLRAFFFVSVAFVLSILSIIAVLANPAGPALGGLIGTVSAIVLCYAAVTVRRTKVELQQR
ncbi:hypothetical protein HTG_08110 [Natrinema mahii]|nr:hypothetical protein HTG_08110 [Natrinema mahii]